MKFNYLKISKMSSVVALLLVLGACSKSKEISPDTEVPDGTNLVFAVSATEGEEGGAVLQANASKNSAEKNKMTEVAAEQLYAGNGFDAIVSAKEVPWTAAEGRPVANKGLKASSNPIGPNIKYRIIVIDKATGTTEKDTVSTMGSSPNVKVLPGRAYDWYVYSLNETVAPPAMNASGMIPAAQLANKDLLYKSGTLTAVNGANNLGVVLQHKTAAIAVVLDARGMDATIANTTSLEVGTGVGPAFANLVKTGDFNVKGTSAGTFSNLQTAPAITANNMIADATNGNLIKTAYFYSAATPAVAANTLSVRLNPLAVTFIEGNTNASFPNSVIALTNNQFTPAIGSLYRVNASLLQRAVVVGPIAWASTNLFYDAADAVNQYKFRPFNNYVTDPNVDYWNRGAVNSTPATDNTQVDPCKRVAGGNWRLPTRAEFQALMNISNNVGTTTFFPDGHARLDWAVPVGSVRLRFPAYGYRAFNSTQLIASPNNQMFKSLQDNRYYTNNVDIWFEYMTSDEDQFDLNNYYVWGALASDYFIAKDTPRFGVAPTQNFFWGNKIGLSVRCVRPAQ